MRPSPWSLGFIMIVFAGGSLLWANTHGPRPGVTAALAAGALAVGGAALFVRRRQSFWVALAGTLVTVGFAAVALLTRRELGLPMPPGLALVVGLYVGFRLVLARPGLEPPTERTPIADSD